MSKKIVTFGYMATTIVNYRSVKDIQPSTITAIIQLPVNLVQLMRSPNVSPIGSFSIRYPLHY
ncbi:hypothetical protein BH23THE1_BH23THE1_22280 [soil metagenome]